MKKDLCLLAFILLLSFSLFGQSKDEVISKVWEGAGGKKVWEQSRFLTFTFQTQKDGKAGTSRKHLWDRYSGDYRFESSIGKKPLLVLFNINTRKGSAYLDGRKVADSVNAEYLKKAYAYYINDSYWLLVPVKLQDPGVNSELEESEKIEGRKNYVLHINFDKVGLTPGDQYWLYIDVESGQISRWKHLLQGQKEYGIYNWSNYKNLGGGLKLSTLKQNINQNFSVTFPQASVLRKVDRKKFTSP